MSISIDTVVQEFVWSSDIPEEIYATTDYDYLFVEIRLSNVLLFSARLNAINGQVCLYNTAELVESYLLSSSNIREQCSVRFYSPDKTVYSSLYFYVFLSNRKLSVGVLEFFSYNFAAIYPSCLAADNTVCLNSIVIRKTSLNVSYSANILFSPANSQRLETFSTSLTFRREIMRSDGNYNMALDKIYLSKAYLLSLLIASGYDVADISSCSICRDDGAFYTIYFIKSLPVITVTYLNNFGYWETLPLEGAVTEKTKKEASVAVLGRKSLLYDVSVDKEYEFVSADITPAFANRLSDILYSRRLFLGYSENPETLPEIIVTSNTSEISSADSSLASVKFTYQFADNVSRVDVSAQSEIFTDQFTPEFS